MNSIRTLILGIGNEILTDDGVGPKLCDFLKENINTDFVRFEKLNVGGMEILEFIQDYENVIFLDAIKTQNGRVGDVYLFTPDDFKETLHLSNLHDINFITALELGRSVGFNIPEYMYIIAIEIEEDMVFSNNFSESLENKYFEVRQKVLNNIHQLLPLEYFKK